HDALDPVAADNLEDLVRVRHVHPRSGHAVLEDIGHAVGAVLADHDLLARLDEAQRGVEPDEPHAADDEDHAGRPWKASALPPRILVMASSWEPGGARGGSILKAALGHFE